MQLSRHTSHVVVSRGGDRCPVTPILYILTLVYNRKLTSEARDRV